MAAPVASIPGFVLDFRNLFHMWHKEPSDKFSDFRSLWEQQQMKFIHAAKLDALELQTWMKLLYGTIYGRVHF